MKTILMMMKSFSKRLTTTRMMIQRKRLVSMTCSPSTETSKMGKRAKETLTRDKRLTPSHNRNHNSKNNRRVLRTPLERKRERETRRTRTRNDSISF
jgi:hypothetical protein